ncbi:hypothetical protein [Streptomyces sp. NPDC018055]|uniref:hypothetical protein n=1 Tax=Streptomyces sp. NPDC018055 TaxID=3365038 RepID=UPI00378EDC76
MFSTKWYNRDGEVIDTMAANRLLGDPDYKRVALTDITSADDPGIRHRVSTVWLGLDHGYSGGDPVIFETMVFRNGDTADEEWARRYSSEKEAREGHAEIVTVIAATVNHDRIEHLVSWPETS